MTAPAMVTTGAPSTGASSTTRAQATTRAPTTTRAQSTTSAPSTTGSDGGHGVEAGAGRPRIAEAAATRGPWRQPVVWLGLAVFIASLAGCLLMIVLAVRLGAGDEPTRGPTIMKMPLERPRAAGA